MVINLINPVQRNRPDVFDHHRQRRILNEENPRGLQSGNAGGERRDRDSDTSKRKENTDRYDCIHQRAIPRPCTVCANLSLRDREFHGINSAPTSSAPRVVVAKYQIRKI